LQPQAPIKAHAHADYIAPLIDDLTDGRGQLNEEPSEEKIRRLRAALSAVFFDSAGFLCTQNHDEPVDGEAAADCLERINGIAHEAMYPVWAEEDRQAKARGES
jgi:hypothetical protein